MVTTINSTLKHLFLAVSLVLTLSLGLVLVSVAGSAEKDSDDKSLIWQQTSEKGLFDVTLDSQVESSVEINQFLEWVLTVKNAAGEFVTPARISISGGMPMHGHGLPSQPQIGDYLGDGRYLLKGLQFSMNGRWELAFDIQSKDQRDTVVFEFTIDY